MPITQSIFENYIPTSLTSHTSPWPTHKVRALSMAPLIKFVCESLMMELITAYDDAPDNRKEQSRNILWSMDEAGRIGIPNLPEHASTVVGRKISLSMSAQDRSQFTAVYGRDRTANLFTNIRTQLVFSQADFDTAEHYSKRMGETSGYAHSESDYGGEKTSTGKSEREIRLMSPQDFIDMDDGEAVCFMGKKIKPFRIKSMDSRRHPLLAKRLGMKQPELLRLPPLAESQLEKPPAPKPPPLHPGILTRSCFASATISGREEGRGGTSCRQGRRAAGVFGVITTIQAVFSNDRENVCIDLFSPHPA